ncbi:MAG: DapH/DapD/GlmU-related protein [Kiritimatiellia bacterium]
MRASEYQGGAAPYRIGAFAPRPGLWTKLAGRMEAPSLAGLFPAVDFGPRAALAALYGGGRVRLGEGCILQGQLVVAAPGAEIVFGERSFLAADAQVSAQERIDIGAHVLIASGVYVADHDSHSTDYRKREGDVELYRRRMRGAADLRKDFAAIACAPVAIGDHAWIGMNSLILKGVRIGARAIVAAGAVVVKDVPPDVVVAGNPARVVKQLAAGA